MFEPKFDFTKQGAYSIFGIPPEYRAEFDLLDQKIGEKIASEGSITVMRLMEWVWKEMPSTLKDPFLSICVGLIIASRAEKRDNQWITYLN